MLFSIRVVFRVPCDFYAGHTVLGGMGWCYPVLIGVHFGQ